MAGSGCSAALPLATSVALFWLQAAPQYSSAFAPVHHFDGHLLPTRNGYLSSAGIAVSPARIGTFLYAESGDSTALETAPGTRNGAVDDGTPQNEVSYASLLKVIDENHYEEATQSCPYLATETIASAHDSMQMNDVHLKSSYQSPTTPILSNESVNSLRNAAETYFKGRREDGGSGAWGIERVQLDELLSNADGSDLGWMEELNGALAHDVYPMVRSGWPGHDAFTSSSDSELGEPPALTVTSSSIFAAGGYSGAKVAMTTFERDAGLFVVHIDLGNEIDQKLLEEGFDKSSVMGALFLETLTMQEQTPIVGPLSPGQVVVHSSSERTAAIMVPSNIHDLDEESKSSLDCLSRRTILQAAESARHYSLRLVLTTKSEKRAGNTDGSVKLDTPEAPAEERSYRLRSYARFRDVNRVQYLTLASLAGKIDDYETQLWLGFDYISRADKPDYQFEVYQRLSDLNKALFHLEKAAELCPTDSRIHFQLATAIGAKMDCDKHLLMEGTGEQDEMAGIGLRDETVNLLKTADALERSAMLESAAVRLGVNGIQDLTICLGALAETRCKLGEFDKALAAIDQWAECGSIRSSLAIEDPSNQSSAVPDYEWIQTPDQRNVAAKTLGVPVFDPEDVALLRGAADRRFALAAGIQTSRYTMQYEGNSEVHLDDLCAVDPILKDRIDQILQEKVYPMVRSAFSEDTSDGEEPPLGPLCVYDSIFVRYNGDVAKAAGRIGASQPLHQDGGIYSVNIALNAHKDDDDNGFTGGGTFLEALTLGDCDHIQRPIAPGHAIIHKTTQRHAGAPTTSGVRDILVIFLSARRLQIDKRDENTWRIERAMRLESIAKTLEGEKIISGLKLARDNNPTNSEVYYWLGVNLIQGDMNDPSDERWQEICDGVESLESSSLLNPADARARYTLGMAIATRHKYAMRTKRAHLLPSPKEAAETLVTSLETAIFLEEKCEKAGCKNGMNLAAAYLALGDFMARLKEFDKAISYLNQVEDRIRESGDTDANWAYSMMQEVVSMLEYCNTEAAKKL